MKQNIIAENAKHLMIVISLAISSISNEKQADFI